jgi:hypothetical protein
MRLTQCKIFNKNHKRGRQTGLANDPWTVRPDAERAEDWFVRLAVVLWIVRGPACQNQRNIQQRCKLKKIFLTRDDWPWMPKITGLVCRSLCAPPLTLCWFEGFLPVADVREPADLLRIGITTATSNRNRAGLEIETVACEGGTTGGGGGGGGGGVGCTGGNRIT